MVLPPVAATAGSGATQPSGAAANGSTGTGTTGASGGSSSLATAGAGATAGSGVAMMSGAAAGSAAAAGGSSVAGAAGTSDTSAAAGSTATAGGQAGVGSMEAGAGGSSGSEAAGSGGEGPAVKHACLTKPEDMVFIGDSYVNYIVAHTELNILVANDAVKDGALKMGQVYPDYAVAGTTLAAPPAQIPGQWTQAKAANQNIKFVVMDGGGNDVLINNMQCKVDGAAMDPTCQQVVMNSLDTGKMMMSDMKASGVTEVIYFFYPHPPTGGWEIDDYTIPMLQDVCASLSDDKFQCRVVDTVPIFDGHDDWYFTDGIHANDIGEQAIADAVWAQLKADCAAQAPSSGCCIE